MKTIGLFFCLMALLAACSVDDAENSAVYMKYDENFVQHAVYDGEWTVNKQVVDTARLEVNGVLKVRLPEDYLSRLCFPDRISAAAPKLKGEPAVIFFNDQGYTATALFNSITSTEKKFDGMTFFIDVSFTVAIDGVDHRVDLLSNKPGNAVYWNDNDQWTIGITITSFYVTNLATSEEQVRTPDTPVILYYNTKNRIR